MFPPNVLRRGPHRSSFEWCVKGRHLPQRWVPTRRRPTQTAAVGTNRASRWRRHSRATWTRRLYGGDGAGGEAAAVDAVRLCTGMAPVDETAVVLARRGGVSTDDAAGMLAACAASVYIRVEAIAFADAGRGVCERKQNTQGGRKRQKPHCPSYSVNHSTPPCSRQLHRFRRARLQRTSSSREPPLPPSRLGDSLQVRSWRCPASATQRAAELCFCKTAPEGSSTRVREHGAHGWDVRRSQSCKRATPVRASPPAAERLHRCAVRALGLSSSSRATTWLTARPCTLRP